MCRQWSPLRRFSGRWLASQRAVHHDGAFISIFMNDGLSATAPSPTTPLQKRTNAKSPDEYGNLRGRFSKQYRLTMGFMALTIILSSSIAFFLGCIVHNKWKHDDIVSAHQEMYYSNHPDVDGYNMLHSSVQLPAPTILPGKQVPDTLYSSKNYIQEGIATSHTVHIDRQGIQEDVPPVPSSQVNDSYYHEEDGEEEVHLPAGQHLLVDIKDVGSTFLNSEEQLAAAMIKLTEETTLTLLSYHCHSLVPIGVSCAGVLLESHVAFHTWPLQGVITLDLFTCGNGSLLPVLPIINNLFGIPRSHIEGYEDEEDIVQPSMIWSHKMRGFRDDFAPPSHISPYHDLHVTLEDHLSLDLKNEVVSTQTDFQKVDVYEVLSSKSRSTRSYHKSLSNDGSYESTHPEQFGPNRILFLDGVIQSTLYGDASYHESIVHPAMIAHDNPKRVAIIGGGEGATLREVLKHSTLEEVVMIEIDKEVVELSRDYLPQWQDCSSIAHHMHKGASKWCFDDARATAKFDDAMKYFIEFDEKAYDLIIMDALDPNDDIPFAVELYTSDDYIRSLFNALNQDGILVVQVGESPNEDSPADKMGAFANRAIMMDKLVEVGFKSIHVYEEAHSGFLAPWTTLVAFKDIKTRKSWYRNAAEIELQLQKRILPTKSGTSSLRYFDGTTMRSYQLPTHAFETVQCRQEIVPKECKTMDFDPWSLEGNNTTVHSYNPIIERHNAASLKPREHAILHNKGQGWEEVLVS